MSETAGTGTWLRFAWRRLLAKNASVKLLRQHSRPSSAEIEKTTEISKIWFWARKCLSITG